MSVRQDLHRLVDQLPKDREKAVADLLRRIVAGEPVDPVFLSVLLAPLDDEEPTDQERAAIAEAAEDLRAGRVLPHEEIVRRYGHRS